MYEAEGSAAHENHTAKLIGMVKLTSLHKISEAAMLWAGPTFKSDAPGNGAILCTVQCYTLVLIIQCKERLQSAPFSKTARVV